MKWPLKWGLHFLSSVTSVVVTTAIYITSTIMLTRIVITLNWMAWVVDRSVIRIIVIRSYVGPGNNHSWLRLGCADCQQQAQNKDKFLHSLIYAESVPNKYFSIYFYMSKNSLTIVSVNNLTKKQKP